MKKIDWIILIMILFTFGIGIYFYPVLPDQIPIHWNLKGEVDNYGDKFWGTFFMPFINLGIFFLMKYMPKIDPRKQNYFQFIGVYDILRYTFHIFFVIMYFEILLHSMKGPEEIPAYLKISFIVPLMVSILMIITGNYLGKVKDNFFVGIRTPWTLSSKEVWYKTHRLGSKLFVLSGLLGVIGSFFPDVITFIMLIVPLLATVVITTIYSYVLYQREKRK